MSPPLSVTHVCNSEIKQLRPLFFAILWDIDLIFGMWVYNDTLQTKFTFRSSPMIFGRVMALGLWNLAKYLVVTTLFHYDLRYWLDFWYESVTGQLWNSFVILSLLLRELKKGETFASLLNIHGGDIRVVPTHLVLDSNSLSSPLLLLTGVPFFVSQGK